MQQQQSKGKHFHLPKGHFLFTSESVSAGHPDKICDYISDSILDACLREDPNSKVACECAVKNNICMVFGEVTTGSAVHYEQVVRQAIKDIGYDTMEKGFDYRNAVVIVSIDRQSQEIGDAVHVNKRDEDIGAGDQGLMIGYATDETPELMPLSHMLCCQLVERLHECRIKGICDWMYPDAKVQVTVEYKRDKQNVVPLRIHNVLISQQHSDKITQQHLQADLLEKVIKPVIPTKYIDDHTVYHLNPSGSFHVGGPCGDAGLTGRKIIVDTYGGWGGHGGGAFSGKDASKVDRSAAYAARWVAKSLVASGACKRAMIQVAYGIGITEPLSIYVNSYNTCVPELDDDDLQQIVEDHFDLRPGIIIRDLQLKRPIFRQTAHHGHFGHQGKDFLWETPKPIDWKAWKAKQK